MSNWSRGSVICATMLSILAPAVTARLAAQSDTIGDTTSLETLCGRNRAALARGVAGEAYVRAISGIQSCGAMAGEALAQQWQRPPSDSAALAVLAFVSGGVRDRRIYEAARDVATSPGNPTDIRLAAIAVLAAHADASVRLTYVAPKEWSVSARAGVLIERLVHLPNTTPTGAPLPGTVRSDVLSLLARIGEADPDARVQQVSAYVARRMEQHLY